MIDIFVGYDPRESSAYHTFCNSVIERASEAVRFTPLFPNLCGVSQKDGSNTFGYSRFLVPHLMGYKGRAIFMDGDMLCLADIAPLESVPLYGLPVACVKHKYLTKAKRKYLDSVNEDYPCKNWSSVMVFDCEHEACAALTPQAIQDAAGAHLHQFKWAGGPTRVAPLHPDWNHLVGEYPMTPDAKVLHYTLGTPCFPDYYRSDNATEWRIAFALATRPVPPAFTTGG